MDIFLDIETIPTQRTDVIERISAEVKPPAQYTKAASIEKWMIDHHEEVADERWHKTALDGGYGELVVACYAVGDGPIQTYQRGNISCRESTLLADLFGSIRADCAGQMPRYVGHNIGFDLRFLHHRAVVLQVKPPSLPYNDPPWRGCYYDTMHEWCGARGGIALTTLCDVLGIEAHDEIDGEGVWDAYRAGRVDQVVQHCQADVSRVREVVRRMWFEGVGV